MCQMKGCSQPDTQEHRLNCEKLLRTNSENIRYSDIYSNDKNKQVAVTKLFAILLQRREDASADTAGTRRCPAMEENGKCSDHCLLI